MWDLKLQLLNSVFYVNLYFYNCFFYIFNVIDPLLYNGLSVFNWKIYYRFVQNLTFFFAFKFIFVIAFLILIRGGTPRYRYDYLTKLGWLKFIGFIVLVFFISLIVTISY